MSWPSRSSIFCQTAAVVDGGFRWWFSVLILVFVITLCGCGSYDSDVAWIKSVYPSGGSDCNPCFIFDRPSCGGGIFVSSEDFHRRSWPSSDRAYSSVSTGDITRYDERVYSDQYITSSGRPVDRFHRYIRGRRERISFR